MTRASGPALLVLVATLTTAACGAKTSPVEIPTSPPPSSSSPSPSASVELPNVFENSTTSINYPADWEQQDQESGTLLFAPGRVAVVGVQVAVWRKGLSRLADPALDVEKGSVTGFRLIDQTNGSLDGNDAIQFTYTGTSSGDPSRAMALWAVSDDHAYRVSFRAAEDSYDTLLPVAEAMIASFQIR
jgi:photosystem II reaction center protein PsbP